MLRESTSKLLETNYQFWLTIHTCSLAVCWSWRGKRRGGGRPHPAGPSLPARRRPCQWRWGQLKNLESVMSLLLLLLLLLLLGIWEVWCHFCLYRWRLRRCSPATPAARPSTVITSSRWLFSGIIILPLSQESFEKSMKGNPIQPIPRSSSSLSFSSVWVDNIALIPSRYTWEPTRR